MADVDEIQQGPRMPEGRIRPRWRRTATSRGRTIVLIASLGGLALLVASTLVLTRPSVGSPGLRPPERVYSISDSFGPHMVITPRLDNNPHATLHAVAGSHAGYVMLSQPDTDKGPIQVWASPDGQAWTRRSQIHGLADARPEDVAGTRWTNSSVAAPRRHVRRPGPRLTATPGLGPA